MATKTFRKMDDIIKSEPCARSADELDRLWDHFDNLSADSLRWELVRLIVTEGIAKDPNFERAYTAKQIGYRFYSVYCTNRINRIKRALEWIVANTHSATRYRSGRFKVYFFQTLEDANRKAEERQKAWEAEDEAERVAEILRKHMVWPVSDCEVTGDAITIKADRLKGLLCWTQPHLSKAIKKDIEG